ncbi:MAG: hypothetical protein HY658_12310 [Actinobacteria bacterium]|nr:hypothetical protein [Actinomycetota bacterium]
MDQTASPRDARRRPVAAFLVAVATFGLAALGPVVARPGPPSASEPSVDLQTPSYRRFKAGVAMARAQALGAVRAAPASAAAGARYLAARNQVMRMLRQAATDPVAPGAFAREWTPLGPTNVGGRVRALVVDPHDTDVLYAGGVAGGVWKSIDAGASWEPLTETFSNIGVSSIAIDPHDPDVLYVGTGEHWSNRYDAAPFNGVGIMKTTDGGSTWRLLRATTGNPDFRVVHDILISATDPNVLYAGTTAGVARSLDGGRTWQTVLRASSGTGCGDLAIRTDRSPDVVLASCADSYPDGVYRSEDGGASWTKVIDSVNGERGGLASISFAPSDQDIAYASVARTADSPRGSAGTLALLRSEDGGRTWSVRNSGTPPWLSYCPDTEGQGFYANAIAVDPTDPDRIWLGGIDAFRSDDGGRTVTIAAYWWLTQPPPSPAMHADHHAIVFDPGYDGTTNRTVYFATDGGVFRTRDDRARLSNPECDPSRIQTLAQLNDVVYEPLNDGLSITQFWAGTVSDDGTILMGGTQDNGTWIRPRGAGPSGWRWAIGGDGFDVAIAPANDLFYGEIYGSWGIRIMRSSTGGFGSFEEITASEFGPPALDDTGLFFTPFVMDPGDPQTLWTGGHYMWRSRDGGDVWVAASERLTGGGYSGPEGVSAIAIAPSDTDVVYAGSSGGALFVTTNASASPPSWSRLSQQRGYITSIAIHPGDPRTAYVTVGWFDVPHVLKTTDGGATWSDIGGHIPNVPVSAVAINPLDPRMVFVGTDAGLFESPNGGRTWFPANGNLASTIVSDLVFRKGTSELYLFTHGRGAFRVDVGTGG